MDVKQQQQSRPLTMRSPLVLLHVHFSGPWMCVTLCAVFIHVGWIINHSFPPVCPSWRRCSRVSASHCLLNAGLKTTMTATSWKTGSWDYRPSCKTWLHTRTLPTGVCVCVRENELRLLLLNMRHLHCAVPFLDSLAVREFLCLDDPPGPFDSLEESRVSVCASVCTCARIQGVPNLRQKV